MGVMAAPLLLLATQWGSRLIMQYSNYYGRGQHYACRVFKRLYVKGERKKKKGGKGATGFL